MLTTIRLTIADVSIALTALILAGSERSSTGLPGEEGLVRAPREQKRHKTRLSGVK